ncbi:MAG: squalene synthase HpnC [Planctomycetes bacterium]|nr:squalene synthase HpnC [Planctomycetota bacterium]
MTTLAEARAWCERRTRTHYENFTVGSWLLPAAERAHLYAIYAYARGVDDLGDEFPGDRLAALDAWERELDLLYQGRARDPVFVALQETVGRFQIPDGPFRRLIQANRMDQVQARWPTWEALRGYTAHSADPVGHLVLYCFGYRDAERQRLSDSTCTALQLANFWQDVAVDWARGRVYIPEEDLERFGVPEGVLASGRPTEAFRRLMAFEVERARALFREGLALVERVEGKLRLDLALYSRGGLRVLDKIERQGFDVLSRRTTLSRLDKLEVVLRETVRHALGPRRVAPEAGP